ncbi:putative proline--tRNA ligase, partial [Tropilaelaps mercedesae]
LICSTVIPEGGSFSHEYHYELPNGEDRVAKCPKCREHFNIEATFREGGVHVDEGTKEGRRCPRCREVLESQRNCAEVAHTFMLGNIYSKKLKANCLVNMAQVPMEMGCYGIGVTRILSAAAQMSPTSLPISIAPFNVAVIGPKAGAINFDEGNAVAEKIAAELDKKILPGGRVILDDRHWTIGRRLREQQASFTSFAIVVDKNMQLELHQFATVGLSGEDTVRLSESSRIEPKLLSDESAVYDFFDRLRQQFNLS